MSSMFTVEENEDLFDRLPDAIVLTIFDKVQDAKSLCISSSLCKRFQSLITQTQHISLTIQPQKQTKSTNFDRNLILGFLNRVVLKPLQFLLSNINKWNPISITNSNDKYSNCCTCLYPSPTEFLSSFEEIKKLEVRLPSPDNDISNLKWKAEFGSQLKSCLIVGGASISPIHENQGRKEAINSTEITNDELKLRVVWTISCLIAASARHCLLEETIKEKKTINNVVITDENGQGKCCMNGEQVAEMRRNVEVISSNRVKVPALKVKMWYVPELELPRGGCVMKGATLVVIKPAVEWVSKADDGGDVVAGGFGGEGKEEDKVFDEVAREMVKLKSCYTLEMNSF